MPSVLVTGAAGDRQGDRRAPAIRGWDVIAGVRSERTPPRHQVNPQRISSVILDVTDAGHIAALNESLPERLDAVVNNAGVAVGGPMETVTPDEWRKQLEINVIGQLAVTQAVLPRLRKSRGRVRVHLQRQRTPVDVADRCLLRQQVRAGSGRRRAANGAAAVAHRSSRSWSPRRPTPTCGAPPTTWSSRPRPR